MNTTVQPDQSKLYVNESDQRRVWSYDLAADGKISNKTLFYSGINIIHKTPSCNISRDVHLRKAKFSIVGEYSDFLAEIGASLGTKNKYI